MKEARIMQLPVQITYRNMEPSETVETMIHEKATKLDRFYDRIMSCRVVIEAPHKAHRFGTQYQVRLTIGVPGGEIVVNRDPAEPAEFKELPLALRDAFDAARRQLEDYARRQRGEVKSHE